MMTIVRKTFGWVLTKLGISPQLAIGYALLVVAVGGLGMGTALWMANSRLSTQVENQGVRLGAAEVTIDRQQDVLDQQANTITTLTQLRLLDSNALTALMGDIKSLAIRDKTVQDRLKKLETLDETVREYLNGAVPPDLACLYDRSCTTSQGDRPDKDGSSTSSKPADAKMRPLQSGRNSYKP